MSKTTSPYQEAFARLVRVKPELAGLTSRARQIIEIVVKERAPLTLNEIAERLEIDRTGVSRLVVALAEAGFVNREIAPEDARRTIVKPTRKGRSVDRDIRAAMTTATT